MIEFFLLSIISGIFCVFFLWIKIERFAIIPIFFLLLYILSSVFSFSFHTSTKERLKIHSTTISRCLVLIGIIILLINQWLIWYHVIIITTAINITLYYSSYKWNYNEGKSLFSRWIIITQIIGICYAIFIKEYHSIDILLSITSIILLWLYHSILLFHLEKKDQDVIYIQQELSLYLCCYIILYRLFQPNFNAVIVTQLRFTTWLIAIRQNYLSTKDRVINKKKDWLSGRSLLAWQKVLERYDNNTKWFSITFFTKLIQHGYMPSESGMKYLQYIQLISIIILVIISIIGIMNDSMYTLIWYRLGILCFIITLFGIQSQEKFITYYKPIALGLITGAYYITLFDSTKDNITFMRWSLIRLCINMITCLFHR